MVQGYVNGNYPDQPVLDADGAAIDEPDGTPMMMKAFNAWGWRIPFLGSILCAADIALHPASDARISAFKKMKVEGTASKAPLTEAFGPGRNALVCSSWPVIFVAAIFTGMLTTTIAAVLGHRVCRDRHRLGAGATHQLPVVACSASSPARPFVWYSGQVLRAVLPAERDQARQLHGERPWSPGR